MMNLQAQVKARGVGEPRFRGKVDVIMILDYVCICNEMNQLYELTNLWGVSKNIK